MYCGNEGEQEKLTEEDHEDQTRDVRLHKRLFCVDCVNYFLVFIVFLKVGYVTTNFLHQDAYLGWLLCEMVCNCAMCACL